MKFRFLVRPTVSFATSSWISNLRLLTTRWIDRFAEQPKHASAGAKGKIRPKSFRLCRWSPYALISGQFSI